MSLTCALLATSLQQWARRYLWVTQPRCGAHRRSRVRSFFAEGVDKLHLPWAVETLPILLHGSLFLFFSGLVVFLFNIHHTVFTIVLWWVGLLTGVYICITFMPIFRQDSPYYTPLSGSVWFLATSFVYILFKFLCWYQFFYGYSSETWVLLVSLKCLYLRRLSTGWVKAAKETARGLGPGIDGRPLLWMFGSLDEDHDLERFFAAIPGFCNSKVVVDPLNTFTKPNDKRLSAALIGFMDRTLSSNLISDSVKQRRVVICRTAVDVTSLSASQQILRRALLGTWDKLFNSIDFPQNVGVMKVTRALLSVQNAWLPVFFLACRNATSAGSVLPSTNLAYQDRFYNDWSCMEIAYYSLISPSLPGRFVLTTGSMDAGPLFMGCHYRR